VLNIRLFKLALFVFIFVASLTVLQIAFASYYVGDGSCNPNEIGVKVGEWCYPCSKTSDGVCPNDFVAGTCDGSSDQTVDYDCVSSSCTGRTLYECSAKPGDGGNCVWPTQQCSGNLNRLYYSGPMQCIKESDLRYECTIGQCDPDGAGGTPPVQCCANGADPVNCGRTSCDASKHLQGSSCDNTCNVYQCTTCTPACSCQPGWKDANGNPADGCETPISAVCSQRSQADCGFDNKCSWCVKCDQNNRYSGYPNGKCVDNDGKSCIYTYVVNQCNAICDPAVGCTTKTDCDTKDGCYTGTYRDYIDQNQICVNGVSCQDSSCTSYTALVTDNDGDGYDIQCDNDCNDNNAAINPGAAEICDNIDNNCNGGIDEGLNFRNYYIDNDGDGYGSGAPVNSCQSPGANYVTQGGDCNDNNAAINPGAAEICDNIDNNCNGQVDEGLSEEQCQAKCVSSGFSWTGNGGNLNCCGNNANEGPYEANELTCNDNRDNDCDGVKDCADTGCAGEGGPNGLLCCQNVATDCPASTQAFTSCLNDNTRGGSSGTFTCEQSECKPSTTAITESCSTGCCFPGGGVSVCENQGTILDIETPKDNKYEICSSGDWKGGNCQGQTCVDDPSQPDSYQCITASDCNLNAGECGEVACVNNVCITRTKNDAEQACESLATSRGYECAAYSKCEKNVAGNEWSCKYSGQSYLCGQKGFGFDVGCSFEPNYKCNQALCLDLVLNPCKLCYSQCVVAANDPDRLPESDQECSKNGYWALCGG